MTKQLTQAQIKEGIIIGIKARNKRKVYCKWGHILPPRQNGRRTCMICVKSRINPEKIAEYNRKRNHNEIRIRESKFPMIEVLKIKGIVQ